MRQARIKVDAEKGEAVYHCMSRVVNGERLLDNVAMEVFRRQLWQIAAYTGVEIVTYAILSNHFHVLVRVPQRAPISDFELLRRFKILYPIPTQYQSAQLEVVKGQLQKGGEEALAWRKRHLAMMGDVSSFMKLLKQRFTIWFNRNHQRYGTLWAERFKSVLVEPFGRALSTMATYIDLNAVRAGLVDDPKDYRFCGYAEAVGGNQRAQAGLMSVTGGHLWSVTQAAYRQMIFGSGSKEKESVGRISAEAFAAVIEAKGKLPLAVVLRSRVRYFTDGAVLGSRKFLEAQLFAYRQLHGPRKRTAPRPLPEVTDWGDLGTLRSLRKSGLG